MSRPFSRVLNPDRPPTGDELLADLVAFHEANPAITEATLGGFTTAGGKTGYDLLVEALPPSARSVLDLGSGNGPLTRRLSALPSLTSIVALDACAADLELARRSLDDPRVRLVCEPAQRLSLPDRSLDAALSHHAFYLFQPLDPVIAALARCLRPGGLFAFVTSSPRSDQYAPFWPMMQAMNEVVRPHNPHFTGWMDPRLRTVEGMSALFCPATGFQGPLGIDLFELEISEPAGQLCDRMLAFFYTASLLPPAARQQLRRRWLALLEATAGPDGAARLVFPSALVSVRAG